MNLQSVFLYGSPLLLGCVKKFPLHPSSNPLTSLFQTGRFFYKNGEFFHRGSTFFFCRDESQIFLVHS